MHDNSIWIVDEDEDDYKLIKDILNDIQYKNEVRRFPNAKDLLTCLDAANEAPFIIISDCNLPGMDGFELREKLLSVPNKKFHSVPFIFWSVDPSEAQIQKAYELKAHGFFLKEASIKDWRKSLIHIIEYWQRSKMPSKKDKPASPEL